MNYLSHFVFNHEVCGRPAEPYFALGCALPDLWLRYSRVHRIRWPALRAAAPTEPRDGQLRAGLLNHVAVDQRFHALPLFQEWQRRVRSRVAHDGHPPVLLDFLAHAALELALDQRLLQADPTLVERFYGLLEMCDPDDVAARVGRLGRVRTDGLAAVIRAFFARRFLRHYRTVDGLVDVLRIILGLARIPPPPDTLIVAILHSAARHADPAAVWHALRAG